MKNEPLRIILDTNLWISFLITKNFSRLDNLLLKHKIELLFSEELLNEFIETIRKPKIKKHFSENNLNELLNWISGYSKVIRVQSVITICRDPDDNFLLALAKDGKADFLITGDEDLLVLGKISGTRILTFTDFEKRFN